MDTLYARCMHRGQRESGRCPRDSNGFLKELDAPGLRFPLPTDHCPRTIAHGNLAVAHEIPVAHGPLPTGVWTGVWTVGNRNLAVAHGPLPMVRCPRSVAHGPY